MLRPRKLRSAVLPIAFTALFALAILGASSAAAHPRGPSRCTTDSCNLDILGTFEPFYAESDLAVKPGATIVVENHDDITHTVTSGTTPTPDGRFDTGRVTPGAQVSFTAPTAAGTYLYFCRLHPFMRAQLTVDPSIPEFPGLAVGLTFTMVLAVAMFLVRRPARLLVSAVVPG